MSFWSAASTAWRLGREYTAATDAARQALADGRPVAAVVRAFAERTEGQLDDQAAETLVHGLELGIDYARRGALAAGRIAAGVEQHGPALLDRAAQSSDRVRDGAARAGVLLTRLALRLGALLGVALLACPPCARAALACDGMTDDAPALQAAFDAACNAKERVIQLPAHGRCRIETPVASRCRDGLTLLGGRGAAGTGPVIAYAGAGDRGVDLRGSVNLRIEGVGFEYLDPGFAGALVDLSLRNVCADDGDRLCVTDADCPSACDTTRHAFATNVALHRTSFNGPVLPVPTRERHLYLRHAINVSIDESMFWRGGYHVYGVDGPTEWTSVVNITRSAFYAAARASIWNLTWATRLEGNFWQPQGIAQNRTRAYGHSPGILVDGFTAVGNSFWDLPVGSGERAPWIRVGGSGILIAGNKFESMDEVAPTARGVVIDAPSDGVSVIGNSCKRLARCWAGTE